MALPRPGAVCRFTIAGRRLIWAKPSAMPTGIISCRPRKYRKSSGNSSSNVSSEEPGFPNQVVRPWVRRSSIVACRTVVMDALPDRPCGLDRSVYIACSLSANNYASLFSVIIGMSITTDSTSEAFRSSRAKYLLAMRYPRSRIQPEQSTARAAVRTPSAPISLTAQFPKRQFSHRCSSRAGPCSPMRLRAVLSGGHVERAPRAEPELAPGPVRDLVLALAATLPAVDSDDR